MFRISSRSPLYYTGYCHVGKPVIIGWYRNKIVCVHFTINGEYTYHADHEIDYNFELGLGPQAEQAAHQRIVELKEAIGYSEFDIYISEFYIQEYSIGLNLLPAEFIKYIENRSDFVYQDQIEFDRDIADWKRDKCCVFCWNGERYLNSDGDEI